VDPCCGLALRLHELPRLPIGYSIDRRERFHERTYIEALWWMLADVGQQRCGVG
jgi:hypothetical protein